MVKKIPLFYQWVMELISPHCDYDKVIEVNKFRKLVALRFKLGRPLVSLLLIEMKDMGLIKYEGVRKLKVAWHSEGIVQM